MPAGTLIAAMPRFYRPNVAWCLEMSPFCRLQINSCFYFNELTFLIMENYRFGGARVSAPERPRDGYETKKRS